MQNSANKRLLETLGWSGNELKEFLPQWTRAAKLLGLTNKEIAYAADNFIPTYWDLSYEGVKKFIAACLREVVALSNAQSYLDQGEKLIYVNMPSIPVQVYANKVAGEGKLHVFYPYYLVLTVLNGFFNKSPNDITSSSTKHSKFTSPCAKCALNQIKLSYFNTPDFLPSPTISWNWGLRCQESPKTDELISCLYRSNWNSVLISVPHDAPSGAQESAYQPKVAFLRDQCKAAQEKVSALTGVAVTDTHICQAAEEYLAYLDRIETLIDLVMTADSIPLSGSDLTLLGLCVEMCFDTGFSYIIDALDTIIQEIKFRIAEGRGILPRSAPRLACYFNPYSLPWLDKAFRNNGICLVQGKLYPCASTFHQYMETDSDLYSVMARMHLSIPSTMNMRDETRINAGLITKYPVDGALYGFYSTDSWVGAIQKTAVKILETETGIPHFYIDGSLWDAGSRPKDSQLAIVRSISNYLKISKIGTQTER